MLGIRAAHRHLCLVTPRSANSRVIGLRAVSAHQQRSNSSVTWHKNAQAGFSVGNDLYNKVRPTYLPESIALIREAVKATPPLNIAELGPGTGIFTRNLLAHPAWANSIGRLNAVEPSEGMRKTFEKNIQDRHIITTNGTFDVTGIEDSWADVIIIAQAFHWCMDFDSALKEFSRIMKPHATLALIWNMEDRTRAKWLEQCRNRIEQYENNTPHFRFALWRKAFEVPSWNQLFTLPVEKVFTYNHSGTLEKLVDRAMSKSDVAPLPEEVKDAIRKDITEYIKKGDGKTWIDEEKGVFEYPHQATVVLAHRKN